MGEMGDTERTENSPPVMGNFAGSRSPRGSLLVLADPACVSASATWLAAWQADSRQPQP